MKKFHLLTIMAMLFLATLTGNRTFAQVNLLTQNFDGATFPPAGWTDTLIYNSGNEYTGGPQIWVQSTGGTGLTPYDVAAPAGHSGTHAAGFDSYDIYGSGESYLITPAINLSTYPGGTNTVSFWFYSQTSSSDAVKVYVSTTKTVTASSTLLGTCNTYTIPWALKTYTIPASYTGTVYIIFDAVSQFGYDVFVDDVSIDHQGCTGAPTAAVITTAPMVTPICAGNTFSLSATDANTATGISRQWQQSSSAAGPFTAVTTGNGGTTLNYTTAALTTSTYYRLLETCNNTSTSTPSTTVYYVQVTPATAVTTQPQTATVCPGQNASFTVSAVGANLTYQWQFSNNGGATYTNSVNGGGGNISGVTTPTISISPAILTQNGFLYRVIITGTCGTVTSNAAVLNVYNAPVITSQPRDTTVCASVNAAFSVAATNGLSYQWQLNTGSGFTNIPPGGYYNGQTTNLLTIISPSAAINGYQYRVIISGSCNPATSNVATLHVNGLPAITSQPVSNTVCAGTNDSFTVGATGGGLTYQWQYSTNGGVTFMNSNNINNISGVTTPTIKFTPANIGQNGHLYRVIITGNCAPIDTSNVDTLHVNVVPSASITNLDSTLKCPSDTIRLQANMAPGYTYQYLLNNTQINGATNDTFKATAAGGYTVQVTNTLGCSTISAGDTVRFKAAPVDTVTANGSTSFCQGSSVRLTANSTPGYTYLWRKNGLDISGDTTAVATFNTSGSYTIYESNGTCGTVSAPTVVTASAIPAANITSAGGAGSICTGAALTLSASAGTGYTYQWYLNNVLQPSGTGPNFVARAAGNYTVKVTNNSCTASSSVFPLASLTSPVALATAAGNTTVCTGSTVQLSANTGNNISYQWQYNGTAIPGATASVYTAAATGGYAVNVHDVNTGCNTVSDTIPVVITPFTPATLRSVGSDTVCAPNQVKLYADTGTGYQYTWQLNGVTVSAAIDSFNAGASGEYTVLVTKGACASTSAPVNVLVSYPITGGITVAPPGLICGNTPVLLHAPSGTSITYQWYFNGSTISGANSIYYSASVPGNYSVTAANTVGCADTAVAVSIGSAAPPVPVIAQYGDTLCAAGFSGYQWYFNGQPLINDTSACIIISNSGGYMVTANSTAGCPGSSALFSVLLHTGVANVSAGLMNVKLYPNPAASVVYIDAAAAVNVAVMSMDGKLLIHEANTKMVNISQLANGVYMIAVYDTDNHLLKTEKLVKN